jgi:hypothetical protein
MLIQILIGLWLGFLHSRNLNVVAAAATDHCDTVTVSDMNWTSPFIWVDVSNIGEETAFCCKRVVASGTVNLQQNLTVNLTALPTSIAFDVYLLVAEAASIQGAFDTVLHPTHVSVDTVQTNTTLHLHLTNAVTDDTDDTDDTDETPLIVLFVFIVAAAAFTFFYCRRKDNHGFSNCDKCLGDT